MGRTNETSRVWNINFDPYLPHVQNWLRYIIDISITADIIKLLKENNRKNVCDLT